MPQSEVVKVTRGPIFAALGTREKIVPGGIASPAALVMLAADVGAGGLVVVRRIGKTV
jgi:hypothetical protein